MEVDLLLGVNSCYGFRAIAAAGATPSSSGYDVLWGVERPPPPAFSERDKNVMAAAAFGLLPGMNTVLAFRDPTAGPWKKAFAVALDAASFVTPAWRRGGFVRYKPVERLRLREFAWLEHNVVSCERLRGGGNELELRPESAVCKNLVSVGCEVV